MIVGTQSPAREVRVAGSRLPVLAKARDRREHDRHLLDRVDGAALLRRSRREPGMPRRGRATVTTSAGGCRGTRRQTASPVGSVTIAASARSTRESAEPAGAGRLLVGDGVDDEVAGQRDAELGDVPGGDDHAATPPFMSQAPRP